MSWKLFDSSIFFSHYFLVFSFSCFGISYQAIWSWCGLWLGTKTVRSRWMAVCWIVKVWSHIDRHLISQTYWIKKRKEKNWMWEVDHNSHELKLPCKPTLFCWMLLLVNARVYFKILKKGSLRQIKIVCVSLWLHVSVHNTINHNIMYQTVIHVVNGS